MQMFPEKNYLCPEITTIRQHTEMKVKIVNKSAYPSPAYATGMSAGMDLKANIQDEMILAPLGRSLVPTGLYIALPEGYEAQVRPRSGLAAKEGLRPANCVGVCDSDYRGEYLVMLHNDADQPRSVSDGDRVAQMVVLPYLSVTFTEVAALDETERGAGGFGSTGR